MTEHQRYVSGGPAGYAVILKDGRCVWTVNPSKATRMSKAAASALARRLVSTKVPQVSVKQDLMTQPTESFYFTPNGIVHVA